MANLGDRDKRMLKLRFCDGFTQEEIGHELGVSQMQVSRLLRGILETLRTELAEQRGLHGSSSSS
jgi:RNA polymerase sigma-B factor